MTSAAALWVLTSLVDDFAGWGSTIIQWLRVDRVAPPQPYTELITDYALLEAGQRERTERAVRALFTRDEAAALCSHFLQFYPGLAARLQPGVIEVPLYADELSALVEIGPDPGVARCLVRLPVADPPPPAAIVGVAAPWPWPDLEPADVAALIDVRERLGLDPAPALPARAHAPWGSSRHGRPGS